MTHGHSAEITRSWWNSATAGTSASVAQGIPWKRGQEDCKSQNTRKSAVKVPWKWLHNQDWNNGSFKGALTWDGEIACGHTPKNCRQPLTARRRRITLSQGSPLVDYPVQSGRPGNYIHTTNKNIQCEICIYIHIIKKRLSTWRGEVKGARREKMM